MAIKKFKELKKVGGKCPHEMKEFLGDVKATEGGYYKLDRVAEGAVFEYHGWIQESVDVEAGQKINGWMECVKDETPKAKKAPAKKKSADKAETQTIQKPASD